MVELTSTKHRLDVKVKCNKYDLIDEFSESSGIYFAK